MATATATRRPSRSQEEWDRIAREEMLPAIQNDGATMTQLADKYGQGQSIRAALGRIGYTIKGEKIELEPIKASRPQTLAKRVAEARREREPWWRIQLRTGKTQEELIELLTSNGYAAEVDGRVTKAKVAAAAA